MLFNFENVTLFGDSRPLLTQLNYQFDSGKRYFLFGRSGVGKSLFLETLSGLYSNYSGKVQRPPDVKNSSAFLFQRDSLILWLTVRENFELLGIDTQRATEALKFFDLEKLHDKLASTLSVGETQLVSLIRAVLYKPKYLFYDEPFTGLDFHSKKKAYSFLFDFFKQLKELTFFGVSHDLEEVCLLADSVLFLDIEKQTLSQVLQKHEINFSNLQSLLNKQGYV